LVLIICSFNVLALNQPALTKSPNSSTPWTIRAFYQDHQQLQQLSQIKLPWTVNSKQKFAVISVDSQQQFEKIKSLGFKLYLDTKLDQQIKNAQKQISDSKANKAGSGINGFSCYSTVEETQTRMQDMAANYPELTEIIDIGDSWEKTANSANGYDLNILKITNKNIVKQKPVLFISSAIHAREYATAELNTRFAEHLLAQYGVNADVTWMLDHQEVHLLLQTNPDGRKQAETGLLWRKNTNQAYCAPNSDSRGADLNRNYPFKWGVTTSECETTHAGLGPQSEPEVSSLVAYLETIFDDNRGELDTDAAPIDTPGVFVDIHSYSQLILWPWGFSTNLSPNAVQFAAFGKRVAYFNDYLPEPASSLYTVTGGSLDTTYGELGVASIVYELGTAFFQDCDEFESKVYPDNLQSLLYVSRVTRTPYISPAGPDIESLTLIPNYILANQSSQISGVANDDRYNQSNGIQNPTQVQDVNIFINELPWDSTPTAQAQASDGSFNSSSEAFEYEISTNGLATGQQTIFITSKDNLNNEGAVFSKFLNIVDQASVGSLSGVVKNALTGETIENALISINQSQSKSNNLGQFNQYVEPATSQLQVIADGFAPLTINSVDIIANHTTIQNLNLQPYCNLFTDDIENGINSWQAQSPWAISDQDSQSPSHSWTDSPNSNYKDTIDLSLTSPIIDLTGAQTLEINFNHLCETESGYDFGLLEVNFDNSSWQEIFSCNGESAWKSETINTNIPDNTSQMQVRFRLTSDVSITEDGWSIDDINLKVSGQACQQFFSDVIFADSFDQ
jgi:hypothetical protein